MRPFYILFLTIGVTIGCKYKKNGSADTLEILCNQRIDYLNNNYRHEVLSQYGLSTSVTSINEWFSTYLSLPLSSETVLFLNSEFIRLGDDYNTPLMQIDSEKNIRSTVFINKLLLLDCLILDVTKSQINFGEVTAKAFLMTETSERAFYNIAIVAHDSLFRVCLKTQDVQYPKLH